MIGRLTRGQLIAAIGAVVLLVAMFLPWIGVSGPSIPAGITVPSGVDTSSTENIWSILLSLASVIPTVIFNPIFQNTKFNFWYDVAAAKALISLHLLEATLSR